MIEFQYFEGCPHYKQTFHYLKELIDEGYIKEDELEMINVRNIEQAEEIHFQGSPSILFNGIDIYTEKEPVSYNYSCRIYQFENRTVGTLPKEFIKHQIIKLASKA